MRSGPGPGTRVRRAASAAPVPAAGSSGARRSRPRAAATSSTATIRRRFATAVRSLRAAPQRHRDVVLLHRARRQRVDARRHRQAAVLGDHRRLRVLREHQPRVRRPASARGTAAARASASRRAGGRCGARPSRRRRRRRSRGSRRRSRAARRGSCRTTRRGRRGAPSGCRSPRRARSRRPPSAYVERVARGAVDLRRAAERVGVLHARVADRGGSPRSPSPRAGGAGSRRSPLARVRPERQQVGGEGAVGAEQRLDRHRGRDVGEPEQRAEVVEREHEHAEDAVGAVDEREALLRARA